MSESKNPFWAYSLSTYGRPGMAPHCLLMQDRFGLDVNMLLFCCWLGSLSRTLSVREMGEALDLAESWATPVIRPLRAVRRHLKPLAGDNPEIAALREEVARLELASEQILQDRLYEAFRNAVPETGKAVPKAAAHNLMLYLHGAVIPPIDALQESLLTLVSLAFPEADEADIVTVLAAPAIDQLGQGTGLMRDGATVTLRFEKPDGGMLAVTIADLIVGGWSGRDHEALQHHIDELAELGVAPPSQTPLFYRNAVNVLMQDDAIQVIGEMSSGEVEAVLLSTDEGLWVTVGSDHTDRAAEAYSVAASKQMCPKVLAREAWPLADLLEHWDKITLRSRAVIDGTEVLYQEGTLAAMQRPETMIEKYTDGGELAPGTAMMLGTFAAIGGIRPASRFSMEMEHPVTGAKLSHAYDIHTLPIVS